MALVAGLAVGGMDSARGILFYSTGDPSYHTTAPTGSLAGSGWQFEGSWNGFTGTPIAPHFFITAQHIGGSIGEFITFQDVAYPTIARFDDTNSDLRIWEICGTFPAYAPLFAGSNEVGQVVTVFGRGTQRGAEVLLPQLGGSQLKGWFWGPHDGVQRWGQNVVASIYNGDNTSSGTNPKKIGDLLKMNFTAMGGTEDAGLSGGDSGGGLFIQDSGVWKLAGINYGVDGPFNTNTIGVGFNAALFDYGGLYYGGESNWTLAPNLPFDQPAAFYATRISAHLSWINSVLSQPSPADQPILQIASQPTGPYANVANAIINPAAGTITTPLAGPKAFYRVKGCHPLQLTNPRFETNNFVFHFQ